MSLKVGGLPDAVGKQLSIPLINLGKMDVKMMMMMMKLITYAIIAAWSNLKFYL